MHKNRPIGVYSFNKLVEKFSTLTMNFSCTEKVKIPADILSAKTDGSSNVHVISRAIQAKEGASYLEAPISDSFQSCFENSLFLFKISVPCY